MKKFLAIILSVMMVLGMCSVASFAFYEEDLPAFPEQAEGEIIFAAENVYVEAGGTYDVPVYLVSNYATDITDGFVELGFVFSLTGNTAEPAVVNSVEFADGIKAVKNFYPIENHYGWTQEEYDNGDTMHTNFTAGYVAFAADVSVLNQAKLQVATVNVTVPAELDSEDAYVALTFSGYNFSENFAGFWFEADAMNGGIFAGEFSADDMDANLNVDPDVALGEATQDGGEIFFAMGYMVKYVETPAPSWIEKLIDWVQKTIEDILQVFETVHEYIRTLLPLLDEIS